MREVLFDLKIRSEKNKLFAQRNLQCGPNGENLVHHEPREVVSLTGERQMHKLSSAERSTLLFTVFCVSARREYVPLKLLSEGGNLRVQCVSMDTSRPGQLHYQ
jgi:hypothetical protein